MAKIPNASGQGQAVLRWLVAAAFVAAVILSGLFSGLTNKAGLFYLITGSVAAVFMGFSRREIVEAFRCAAGASGSRDKLARAAYFWEAAARNAWLLGVLGTAMNFTIALGGASGGIADISNRVIHSFIVTLYGLVLAVVCLVPAVKVAGRAEKSAASGTPGLLAPQSVLFERASGTALFIAVLALTIFSLVRGSPQNGLLPIADVLLHGPAILVVVGGAIALALFMGAGAGGRGLTLGFAMTGFISLLMGLIQALFGFVHTSRQEIAAAISFIIAASFFALLGLLAVAAPREDRDVMEGRRQSPSPLSRMFWVVLPLLTFIFLLLTFIMIVTPMRAPGAS